MAVEVSVGELVQLQFPVYDVDGITPLSGLPNGSFGKTLLKGAAVSPVVLSVSEVGATSKYVASFTPDADGLWYVEATTPVDDVYSCYVQVGPPPDDVLDAIADAVWGEALPNGFPPNSAGERLASTDDRVEVLSDALIAANLTVAVGSTGSVVLTGAAQSNGFYDGMTVVVRNSTGNVVRRITSYANASGAFTLSPPLPFTPDPGDAFIVLGILGEVAVAGDSDAAIKLCEIHRILGLDPEAPLCVSKSGQEAGSVRLTQTEVGTKIVVQRVP
jgi:hypothetical protein